MFEDDGTTRTKLITHLGFTLPAGNSNNVGDGLSQDVSAPVLEERTATNEGIKENAIHPTDTGEDFFNNLPSPKADTPVSNAGANFVVGGSVAVGEEIDGPESTDPSLDESVQHALVVGDYKGAVAHCISANRMADALVIAHVGGASLWEKTCDQYLKLNHSPYVKVVSAMVNNDLASLVNARPLKSWKETLALLCTDLMEKTIVLALATGQKQFSASLCKLVEKYAEILASQGLLTTAMEYLKLLGAEEFSPELMILRNHIALSIEPGTSNYK